MSNQPQRRRRRRRPARPAGSGGESEVGRRSEAAESDESRGPGGGRRSGGSDAQPPRRTIFGLPRMSVALLGGLLVAMIAVFALQLIFPTDEVLTVEGVQTFPDQGRRHLAEGDSFDAYNSFPPTSGPQPEQGAPAEVYLPDAEAATPTPVEMLPLLERGGVVIYYDPDVYTSADDPGGLLGAMASLRQFRERLAVVPLEGIGEAYPGATIVLAAWKTLLPVATWDADGNEQISAFMQNAPDGYYDRYRLERGDAVLSVGTSSE